MLHKVSEQRTKDCCQVQQWRCSRECGNGGRGSSFKASACLMVAAAAAEPTRQVEREYSAVAAAAEKASRRGSLAYLFEAAFPGEHEDREGGGVARAGGHRVRGQLLGDEGLVGGERERLRPTAKKDCGGRARGTAAVALTAAATAAQLEETVASEKGARSSQRGQR
jgi:hypothetical protein